MLAFNTIPVVLGSLVSTWSETLGAGAKQRHIFINTMKMWVHDIGFAGGVLGNFSVWFMLCATSVDGARSLTSLPSIKRHNSEHMNAAP